MDKVRVDKWLWAARFFKTRSLAKSAIEGGKIKVQGQRTKPSRDITVGMELEIRQGWDEKIVQIIALSDQRKGAPEAQKLYCETSESLERREREAALRKHANDGLAHPGQRPDKRQRRHIHRFLRSEEE